MRTRRLLAASPLLVAIGAACGNDLKTCEETRSCASDGGSGSAGTSGSSGSSGTGDDASSKKALGERCGAGVECDSSYCVDGSCCEVERCEDGLWCNGVSSCSTGRCVAGSPPVCTVQDEVHCVGTCREGSNAAECGAAARDVDGDQHGDARCGAAPGDDCDDAKASVYTGAPELCDDLDNDCDSKKDLEDGLGIPGEVKTLAAFFPDPTVPAWADATRIAAAGAVNGSYAVVYSFGLARPEAELWFILSDANGGAIGAATKLSTASRSLRPNEVRYAFDYVAAGSTDSFMILHFDRQKRGTARFARVNSKTGVVMGTRDVALPSDYASDLRVAISRSGVDRWAAAWPSSGGSPYSLWGVALDDRLNVVVAPKSLVSEEDIPVDVQAVDTPTGSTFVYRTESSNGEKTFRAVDVSSELVAGAPRTLATTGTRAQHIASRVPGGLVLGLTEVPNSGLSSIELRRFDFGASSPSCTTPVVSSGLLYALDAITGRSDGYDLVFANRDLTNGAFDYVGVQRYALCTPATVRAPFYSGRTAGLAKASVRLASNGAEALAVWADEGVGKLYAQRVGSRICD